MTDLSFDDFESPRAAARFIVTQILAVDESLRWEDPTGSASGRAVLRELDRWRIGFVRDARAFVDSEGDVALLRAAHAWLLGLPPEALSALPGALGGEEADAFIARFGGDHDLLRGALLARALWDIAQVAG